MHAKILTLLVLALGLTHCRVRRSSAPKSESFEDFSIGAEVEKDSADDIPTVQSEALASMLDGFNQPSLPLLVKAGYKVKSFDTIPEAAKQGPSLGLVRKIGACALTLSYGHIEVQRYFPTGSEWVPGSGDINPGIVLKIEQTEPLHLGFSTPIYVKITKSQLRDCQKTFPVKDKLYPIGKLDMNLYPVELIGGPKTKGNKKMKLNEATRTKPVQAFLRWSDQELKIVNSDENILYLKSGIYTVVPGDPGYYYVGIRAQLQ